MHKHPRRIWFTITISGLVCLAAPDFSVREELGRTWANECLSFPLSTEQSAKADAGVRPQ
jgi:hypothetical protein